MGTPTILPLVPSCWSLHVHHSWNMLNFLEIKWCCITMHIHTIMSVLRSSWYIWYTWWHFMVHMVHLVTFHGTCGTPGDISWYMWYTRWHFMVHVVHLVTFHGTYGTPGDISWLDPYDLRWLKMHTQMSSKLLKIPSAACCRCCSSTMPQKGHPEGQP